MPKNSSVARKSRHRPKSNRQPSIETPCEGSLELHPKGYGFLRQLDRNLARREDDPFVSTTLIDRLSMRPGQTVTGTAANSGSRSSGPRLTAVQRIDDQDPAARRDVVPFEDQTPVNPSSWLRLERRDQPIATRIMDLLCPLGRGQRALIASPPKAGKTSILKQIGRSIWLNHPDIELCALLVDERPEEVTDVRSEINGRVFASNLDEPATNHARLSRMVIDHCQRQVETGKHVFLIVDSLTRMARAFNKLPGLSGATGAGGLNIRALDIPKQLFAAARQLRGGGSLTIVASVLIDTENRMDEVIFQEFKGTGNLDMILNRQLADRRIWPAIDILQSSTRRVELLQDAATHGAVTALRNSLLTMPPEHAMKELIEKLARFETNDEFVRMINDSIANR